MKILGDSKEVVERLKLKGEIKRKYKNAIGATILYSNSRLVVIFNDTFPGEDLTMYKDVFFPYKGGKVKVYLKMEMNKKSSSLVF